MNNIQDLNLKNEILPIFDHSLNSFTKSKILKLLETKLTNTQQITDRQDIIKGFNFNNKVLENYSYTVLYVYETHMFLTNFKPQRLERSRFLFSAPTEDEIIFSNKMHQLILFFHRLESHYFSKLNLISFPKNYRKNLNRILSFLSCFQLRKYEELIRDKKIKNKHIKELTSKILKLESEEKLEVFWEDFFQFETYLSLSKSIYKNNFVFPSIGNHDINLVDFYHPMVKNPVKNNFITSGNVIVLNGPNMSGKSTLLKSISLCMYLGNLGLAIPASKGIIPFCNNFSIGINKRDNIVNGYSHFMTEIINLKNVILDAQRGEKCFVVFDELFSGTNVEDALEICTTTINGLTAFPDSYFFISTHIQELQNLTNSCSNMSTFYLDCELVNNSPVFTFKIKKGWSDIKVGRILFDREGLNKLLHHKN